MVLSRPDSVSLHPRKSCHSSFSPSSHADPTSCTGNGIYSSFRNRNFWLEYSTPPTTKFPDYDDYYYNLPGSVTPAAATTTPEPRPHFVDSSSNHTLVQSPHGSTTFLHCRVHELRDFQVNNGKLRGNFGKPVMTDFPPKLCKDACIVSERTLSFFRIKLALYALGVLKVFFPRTSLF